MEIEPNEVHELIYTAELGTKSAMKEELPSPYQHVMYTLGIPQTDYQ